MKQSLMQFIKFGIVGVSNTLISLLVYYLVLWINAQWYLLGNVAGWVISVANAFFWNERYVFTQQKRDFKSMVRRIGKTYLSYGATFLLSTVLLYLEVDVWQWSAVVSPVVNLMITIPLNFLLNKFWAFK